MELLQFDPSITSRNFAESICSSLHKELNVDLLPIFNNEEMSDKQKLSMAAQQLRKAIAIRADENSDDGFDDMDSGKLQLMAEVDNTVPNLAVSESNAVYLSNLQGDGIRNYIFNLTRRFENMSMARSPEVLVDEMIACAVIAVGVPMGVCVVSQIQEGHALREAMLNGVKVIGMRTVTGAAVLVLAALLLYMFLENPKKILGMVLNNTDDNLYVNNFRKNNGNLYMEQGQMVDLMEDNEDGLQSPKLQIKQRFFLKTGSEYNVVYAGIYFANRNAGFRGSLGVMVFTSKTSPLSFAHMFAVPYDKDNRTNMKYLTTAPSNLDSLFRQLYDENKVRVDFVSNGYRLTSTVNAPRGGRVECIAYIAKV